MMPAPMTTRSKVSASSRSSVRARLISPSYPDYVESWYAVVVGIPGDEGNAVGDGGRRDPGVVEGHVAPCRVELLHELRPSLGHHPADRQVAQRLCAAER